MNCRQVIWIIMSDNTGSDERVPDKITRRNRVLKSGEMKTFSSPLEAPHNQQAPSQFPVQLLLAASRNQALKSREMKTFSSPSEAPHNQQASSQFPAQLPLAARSNQCPQTHRCQLQSAQALQATSQPSWPTPQAQVP